MKIFLSDWLTNAGILGFLRLQKLRGFEYDLSKGYIEVEAKQLDGFEEAFFSEALSRQKGQIFRFESLDRWSKKTSDDKVLREKIQSEIELIEKSVRPDYGSFNHTIKSFTRLLKDLEGTSKNWKLETKVLRDFQNELKLKLKGLKKTSKNTRGKNKEKGAKDYVYSFMQKFYSNKEVVGQGAFTGASRKTAFKKAFVDAAMSLLNSGKVLEGLTCRFCKQQKVKISGFTGKQAFKDLFGEGMFAPIAVSIGARNFFYNMQTDMAMCDVCELLLLCSWAGFTEIPLKFQDKINNTQFIFVNVPSLELLVAENKKIEDLYQSWELEVEGTIYDEVLYDLFVKEKERKSEWALQNILFVEIRPVPNKAEGKPNFRYFHIGKDIAQIFIDQTAIKAAKQIRGRIYTRRNKENPRDSVFVYARRDAVRRMLSRDSLYPLCYAAIRDQIENPNYNNIQNAFNLSALSGIRTNIWKKNKQGGTPMESKQIFGILKGFSGAGEDLGQGMDYEKRKRLSYRLLSLIRTGKIPDFYESLLKLYISRNKPIPDALVSLLNAVDAVEPQAKAYAFMSGFLGQEQARPVAPIEATSETTN